MKGAIDGLSLPRLFLSSPHMSGKENAYIQEAFDGNWVSPLGPHVDAFEREFCELVGSRHAAALSSGTAALHLALILAGVEAGDDVMVSSLTFSASVNPIVYLGARPVFLDSDPGPWTRRCSRKR
jgi:dTDP-4-amino-4,6-dideoxygalactose transaminase